MSSNKYNSCRSHCHSGDHSDGQAIQTIEKEYLNSMLGIEQHDNRPAVVHHESIDHNEAYKKSSIKCKIFNIAGLNIAVPASSIREILKKSAIEQPITKQQTILSGNSKNTQPTMCAGCINFNNEMINIIDIEYLAMNISRDCKHKLTDIVLLKSSSAGFTTGFICDASLNEQTILSEQIHWRDVNSKHNWLAGTVAQLGLALLDIENIAKRLQSCC
ncbi:hypothetical protein MNBD_GAMMA06-2182 [hydrothermal vent metagenome]|uniref:CheW-like domain-containing protein n=1 Tax=hydrothermal vent metagenome TaxID=652676 RepID=A0A3B0X5L8_9ZZZZ